MAIFTADLEKELQQIKSSCDDLLTDSVVPSAQRLLHFDVKPMAKELLSDTRSHGVELIERGGKEASLLLQEVNSAVADAIEKIDEKLHHQVQHFHKQLRKTMLIGTACLASLLLVGALAYRLAIV